MVRIENVYRLRRYGGLVVSLFMLSSAYAFDASALRAPQATSEASGEVVDASLVASDENADESNEDIVALGKGLFGNTCLFCHGSGGVGGRGPSLIAGHWAPGGANDDAYMTDVILNGRENPIMGSFKDSYTADEIKAIIAYLRSEAKTLAESAE